MIKEYRVDIIDIRLKDSFIVTTTCEEGLYKYMNLNYHGVSFYYKEVN